MQSKVQFFICAIHVYTQKIWVQWYGKNGQCDRVEYKFGYSGSLPVSFQLQFEMKISDICWYLFCKLNQELVRGGGHKSAHQKIGGHKKCSKKAWRAKLDLKKSNH